MGQVGRGGRGQCQATAAVRKREGRGRAVDGAAAWAAASHHGQWEAVAAMAERTSVRRVLLSRSRVNNGLISIDVEFGEGAAAGSNRLRQPRQTSMGAPG